MRYISIVVLILLGVFLFFLPNAEQKVRNQVLKLYSDRGSCSAIRVSYKKKSYVVSAAHCRGLEESGHIKAEGLLGKEILEVIAEDENSDLLIMESPRAGGIELADGWEFNEKVFSITHGQGLMAYRTDGELLNVDLVDIPVSQAHECRVGGKYSIKKFQGFLGPVRLCVMSFWAIWSTAKVVPGSSGGAIVNMDGELVGIVSATDGNFSILAKLEYIKRALNAVQKR